MKLEGTMYRGAEPTLEGELTPELLATRRRSRCPKAHTSRGTKRAARRLPVLDAEAFTGIKDGAYAERDGSIVIRNGNSFEPAGLSASAAARIRGMMAVRDAVRLVFRTQLDDAPERTHHRGAQAPQPASTTPSSADTAPSPPAKISGPSPATPTSPSSSPLKTTTPSTKRAHKTAIFERRTLERYRPADHVETAAEALAISLNETGRIDWPRMDEPHRP